MVGTAADGQLTTTARDRSAVRFAVATPDDDPALRRLLRTAPMHGATAITLEREPSYFRGANLGGADDRTIVAHVGEQLVCMGRSTTRSCWINGQIRRVSYLAELRMDPSARGRLDILRHGYHFFRSLAEATPTDLTFTSIAADNDRTRRLLECGAPGLPRYEFLGGLTTLLVATPRARGTNARLEPASRHEFAAFLDDAARHQHIAAAWTPDTLRALASHNLAEQDCHVVRDGHRVISAGALWDQRGFRQTVIQRYAPALRFARPWLNLLAPIAGLPRLPAPGGVLSHAFLSPLALAPECQTRLPDIVAAFCQHAAERRIQFLTLALPTGDSRIAALEKRFRCHTYSSRLYRVRWPGEPDLRLDERPVLPDVSLL